MSEYHKKPVQQYDLNMNPIATFDSVTSAVEKTKICFGAITHCCKGESSSAGGFIWQYIQKK